MFQGCPRPMQLASLPIAQTVQACPVRVKLHNDTIEREIVKSIFTPISHGGAASYLAHDCVDIVEDHLQPQSVLSYSQVKQGVVVLSNIARFLGGSSKVVSKRVVLADVPLYQKPGARAHSDGSCTKTRSMFPRTKNRNEGTFAKTTAFYETALLFPLDLCFLSHLLNAPCRNPFNSLARSSKNSPHKTF